MNRTILITGCSSGVGLEATRLLMDTFKVIGISRTPPPEDVLNTIDFVDIDLSRPFDEEILINRISDTSLFGIVHCAGVSKGSSIQEMDDSDWEYSLNVNLTSAMRLSRFGARHMIDGGRIVFISSPVAVVGAKKSSYSSSKAGLTGLMMSISRELGLRNILVNTILPGPMLTGMTKDWSSERQEKIAHETRLGRLCTPIEIGKMIEFLLSENCTYITASIIDMTAGSMYGH